MSYRKEYVALRVRVRLSFLKFNRSKAGIGPYFPLWHGNIRKESLCLVWKIHEKLKTIIEGL